MTIEQNDPTISGFTPPKDAARLSGNETEMLCLKAARGAGMPWGLAEEAGFAARWLQARGLDGPNALLAHLIWLQGRDARDTCPMSLKKLKPRGDVGLCPIVTGSALSDAADLPRSEVGPVTAPLLLLPFVQVLARAAGQTVSASWPGGRVLIDRLGAIAGDLGALADADTVTFDFALTSTTPEDATTRDARPSADCLAELNKFAMNITVPATQSSRVDAGAGTSDND